MFEKNLKFKKEKFGGETLINTAKDTMDSGIEDLEFEKFQMQCAKTYQIIEKVGDAILPEKGASLHLVTFKPMNMACFIEHVAKHEKIQEMLIAAYSINFESASLIDKIVTENNIPTEILISNLRNQAHRTKEEMVKSIFLKNKNCKLFFLCSHAKIITMRTAEGNYYYAHGSGNLSFNSRVEQWTIDNSEGAFNFTKNWYAKVREHLKNKKELTCFNY